MHKSGVSMGDRLRRAFNVAGVFMSAQPTNGQGVVWDSVARVWKPASASVPAVTGGYPWRDDTLPNAGDITAVLTYTPFNGIVLVFRNGLELAPTEFSLSGNVVTFAQPADAGDSWGFYYETTDIGASAGGGGGGGGTSAIINLVDISGGAVNDINFDPFPGFAWPAGTAAGDIALAFMTGDGIPNAPPDTPAGLTWHHITDVDSGGSHIRTSVYWALATAACTGTAQTAGSGGLKQCHLRVYRGPSASNPIQSYANPHAGYSAAGVYVPGFPDAAHVITAPAMGVWLDVQLAVSGSPVLSPFTNDEGDPLPGHYRYDVGSSAGIATADHLFTANATIAAGSGGTTTAGYKPGDFSASTTYRNYAFVVLQT